MKILTRREAIAQGARRFYTGKPCRHGHDAERFTSNGACVECIALNSAVYRKEVSRLLKLARAQEVAR
ncbi:TPA: hypothetical protein I7721_16515 [Vibrio vulnificus]|nr:hypothetical protein [Vibrio vulnificus]